MVEKLMDTFKLERVALYGGLENGRRSILGSATREGASEAQLPTFELSAEQSELMERALRDRTPQELRFHAEDEPGLGYAVPLVVGQTSLGCLYLEGRESSMALDSSDVFFLEALGRQLAVALDRARLADLERERREGERRRLQAELNELRQALEQAKLIYRSEEMETLLDTVRTVAPTDVTVLVTGESGTGKELLARTLHELSARREKPLVIVDCGAITASLIESELFGHEKGAFTGAQQSRRGRLVEADGGTVLLDEIGELPDEVQSKLLRFVQEKQLTAVGGTRRRGVDVRILAATNRDLAAEVAAGWFRKDLYHRLNVVTLTIPPLRERRGDILHLARYFLESFSVQYQKDVRRLSPDAEALLTRYPWPGNVRELRNRLMQAVVFCQGGVLGPEQLRLPEVPGEIGDSRPDTEPTTTPAFPDGAYRTARALDERPPQEASVPRSPWHELSSALARQIERVSNGDLHVLPFGKWLAEDLVLEAHAAAGGVGRRGAALLGMSPTTFQRRWNQANERRRSGLSQRVPEWEEVRRALGELVRDGEGGGTDLAERTEAVLLHAIRDRFPQDERTGSALLGTTPPTFRRRLAHLGEKSGQ